MVCFIAIRGIAIGKRTVSIPEMNDSCRLHKKTEARLTGSPLSIAVDSELNGPLGASTISRLPAARRGDWFAT